MTFTNTEGNIFKDNSITNSKFDGIIIRENSLNTVVIGNTLAGNENDNIADLGTGTVLAGNIRLHVGSGSYDCQI